MSPNHKKINIAIFASGNGSNAEAIIKYFANHPTIEVKAILSNKKDAFVLERAKKLYIPSIVFSRPELYESDKVIQKLKELNTDYIILAGFLWLIPESLLNAYPDRIINIHPALLPKYGGKGMHGMNVHKTVIDACEVESGITIHLLNARYDDGKIIFQAKVTIEKGDTPAILAEKVNLLEHKYYPPEIEKWIESTI